MKKLLLTLAVSVLAVSAVKAQPVVVDIGGSTAGRTAVHNNIVAMLTGLTYAYDGTSGSPAKATHAIYHGTFGGKDYIIRTYWSGSVNGITPLTAGTQLTQLIDKTVLGLSGGEFIASPTLAPASAETVQEIGFSDIFASTVHETATSVEDEVAVITFKWYANEGTTGITNVTPSLVRNLYKSSEAPKWVFTGNPADTDTVFPIGRDASSGTRGTAMAESGYGNVATVDQYTATVSGNEVTGITYVGNGGFSSGSNVKGVMNSTYSGGVLIGYLGASDFATAGGVELAWNGVTYSTAAIQNGSYSFWGYLHMNRMNSLTGDGLSFYNALKTNISTDPLDSGVLNIGTMNVARDFDGAPIYDL